MIKYTPRCLHHGPACTALAKEASEIEEAISSKLARKEKKDPRGEARDGGEGANETMNVGIPHKVLDYWWQFKQEHNLEKRLVWRGRAISGRDLIFLINTEYSSY